MRSSIKETEREIRSSLSFVHYPLERRGFRQRFEFSQFNSEPFRPIVEEMLLALHDQSARLATQTLMTQTAQLEKFFSFISDENNLWAKHHTPRIILNISAQTLIDFQHWLLDSSNNVALSQLEQRNVALRDYLASNPIPLSKRAKEPKANMAALDAIIGAPQSYINRHPSLVDIVTEAAARQDVAMPIIRSRTRAPSIRSTKLSRLKDKISVKYARSIYQTIAKILRFMNKHKPSLFDQAFFVPKFIEYTDSSVASASLTDVEFENLKKACLKSIREVKQRIAVEGAALVRRGRAERLPGESSAAWGSDLSNLVAYLKMNSPGRAIGHTKERRNKHGHYVEALRSRKLTSLDVDHYLHPSVLDLIPFLLRMGSSEFSPMNLSTFLSLHVEVDAPNRHCLRASPTSGFKRIFFGKPRAQIDQDYIDVPDRSILDIPSLIETLIEITASLRQICPSEFQNSLFLYISRNRGVRALNLNAATENVRIYVATENILGEDGQLISGLHYRRLRPTVIGSVALDNGIEEAQKRASHANPMQTLAYVNNVGNIKRIQPLIASDQSKAISSIRTGFTDKPNKEDIDALCSEMDIPRGAAVEILIGQRDKLYNGCADDENGCGPEIAGRICMKFEFCLVCPNSVILQRHLPRLLSFKRFWLSMADEMSEEIWNETHALNCAIVDQHLTKFDPEVVENANRLSLSLPFSPGFRRFKQS